MFRTPWSILLKKKNSRYKNTHLKKGLTFSKEKIIYKLLTYCKNKTHENCNQERPIYYCLKKIKKKSNQRQRSQILSWNKTTIFRELKRKAKKKEQASHAFMIHLWSKKIKIRNQVEETTYLRVGIKDYKRPTETHTLLSLSNQFKLLIRSLKQKKKTLRDTDFLEVLRSSIAN